MSLRPLWTLDLGARAVCCSAAGDVFVACNDTPEVLRIDARSGTVVATSTLALCAEALQVIGDALVIITGAEVLALEKSFDTRWVRAEPVCSATASNDSLFVLTRDTALTRLDLRNGSVLWSRRVGRHILPQLAAAEDRVVYAVESVVVGLSGAGAVCWVHSAPRRIVAGPGACGAGALAVADRTGIVRVLGIADGKHVASYSALPVRPIALTGSPSTVVGIGADGDVWGIDLVTQA